MQYLLDTMVDPSTGSFFNRMIYPSFCLPHPLFLFLHPFNFPLSCSNRCLMQTTCRIVNGYENVSALTLVWIQVWMFTSGVLGLHVYLCPILFSDVPVFSEMSRVSWPNSCEYMCVLRDCLSYLLLSLLITWLLQLY